MLTPREMQKQGEAAPTEGDRSREARAPRSEALLRVHVHVFRTFGASYYSTLSTEDFVLVETSTYNTGQHLTCSARTDD
jgi:hypothetical protein